MNKISVFYDHICVGAAHSGISVAQALSKARGWGVEQVDINCRDRFISDRSAVRQTFSDCSVGVSCVCCDVDLISLSERQAEDEYTFAFDTAEQFDCDKVLCIPGYFTADEDRSAQFDRACERLAKMCSAAALRGMTVAVEDYDNRLSPCCNTAQLCEMTSRIPGLKIAFDLGNFAFCKESIDTGYRALKSRIVHLHCKDRGFDRSGGPFSADIDGSAMYTLPVGDGDLNLERWIKRLLDDGYDGSLVIEHFGISDQLYAIERSARFLRGLLGR